MWGTLRANPSHSRQYTNREIEKDYFGAEERRLYYALQDQVTERSKDGSR